MIWRGDLRKVEVSSYNEKWIQMFSEEAKKLNFVFGNEVIDIYHIEMQEIRYDSREEDGIVKRRYFQKGENNRTQMK